MALQNPNWLQAGTYTAAQDRLNQQAVLNTAGVIGAGSLAVTAQASPNMTVNIAAGWGAIVPTTSGLGVYGIYNDATVVQTISAANATNPRIDLIVATINDAQYSGSANNVVFTTVAGTPAVSPTVPTTPNNSIVLAQIAVAAATTTITTANITDRRSPVQNALTNANYFVASAPTNIASPTTAAQTFLTGSNLTLAANTTYEVAGVLYWSFTAPNSVTGTTYRLNFSGTSTSLIKHDGYFGTSFTTLLAPSGVGAISQAVALNNAVAINSASSTSAANFCVVEIKGYVRTTTTGTLTPQVGFGSAATNLIGYANSWLKVTPVAGAAFTSVGAWS